MLCLPIPISVDRESTARDVPVPSRPPALPSHSLPTTSIKISFPSHSSSTKHQKDRSQPRPMPAHRPGLSWVGRFLRHKVASPPTGGRGSVERFLLDYRKPAFRLCHFSVAMGRGCPRREYIHSSKPVGPVLADGLNLFVFDVQFDFVLCSFVCADAL
jgi:hypothetical protein